MAVIYDNKVLDHPLQDWQRDAVMAFDHKITNKEIKFPCIPAYQGYILNHMRFGFASNPREHHAPYELASLLKTYGEISRQTGDYSAFVIFFDTPPNIKASFSVIDFERLFWNLLNQVSELDEEDWPTSISTYPEHHTWEFCFNKERYFFYCATPAHEKRQSRHFPYFMLAITPRWVLEKFRSTPERSLKVMHLIRDRLTDYDTIPPHPELKWYGQKDNLEWKQYYFRDDDTTLPTCPFHQKNSQT